MKNRKKVAVFPLPPELRENLNIPIKKKTPVLWKPVQIWLKGFDTFIK